MISGYPEITFKISIYFKKTGGHFFPDIPKYLDTSQP